MSTARELAVRIVTAEMIIFGESSQEKARAPKRFMKRRRARVVVLSAIMLFVVIQGISFIAIDSETLPIRDPIYEEKVQHLKVHKEFFEPVSPLPKRVMALGSSRTMLAFDPTRFMEINRRRFGRDTVAFNFGCAGCGPIAGALYWRRLLQEHITIDTLLIEIHPAMLVAHDVPFEHRWLHDYRLRKDEVDRLRNYGWNIETPRQFRPGGWLTTCSTFRFSALDRFSPSLLPCPFGLTQSRGDQHGYVRGVEPRPEDRARHLTQAWVEYSAAFEHPAFGGAAVEAVRDVLQTCQQRGIRTSLVVMPESSDFRSWYAKNSAASLDQWLAEISMKFGAKLIHARKWLGDEDFADGHHATPAGSARFTMRLAEELAAGVSR